MYTTPPLHHPNKQKRFLYYEHTNHFQSRDTPDGTLQVGRVHQEYYRTGTYRHICKGCYWEVYGRRLRERYILKKVDRGDPMIRF